MFRAIAGAHANCVDICNMSFGERVRTPNLGRFADLVRDLVYKHRRMFVCSAGNHGPGLGSVSCPSMQIALSLYPCEYVGPLVNSASEVSWPVLVD